MAKEIKNEKGFLVLETSQKEIVSVHPMNRGICDRCMKGSFKGYYVAVMNYWMCPDCYNAWYKDATHYKEDYSFERDMYKNTCISLNVMIKDDIDDNTMSDTSKKEFIEVMYKKNRLTNLN